KTGIAAWIVCDHVINKIFLARVRELMRFARAKEKRISGPDFGPAILIADFSFTGDDEIMLRLRRVRMIRAKRFAFWNADECEIERPSLRQIERLGIASKRHGNILCLPRKLPLRRLPLLPLDLN